MMTVVAYCLPILAWLGLAATISSLRPPARATKIQSTFLLVFAAAFLAACLFVAKTASHSPKLLLLGLVEIIVIVVLVYLQLKAKQSRSP